MKKRIGNVMIVIFALLAACTIISTIYYQQNLPRVTEYLVCEGRINGASYPMVVPAEAVYQDVNGFFVYRIKEADGKLSAVRCSIKVIDQDANSIAISYLGGDVFSIATSPSGPLEDGQEIRVIH